MLAIIQIGHTDNTAKGKGTMRGHESVHIEDFAARRLPPMKRSAIPGGHSSFDVGSRRDGALVSNCGRAGRGSRWRRNARACGFVGAARNTKKQEKHQIEMARQ